ncbi:MAG: ComEC/Rec2 family competence protein [Ilumatobacteraceae bacterium]
MACIPPAYEDADGRRWHGGGVGDLAVVAVSTCLAVWSHTWPASSALAAIGALWFVVVRRAPRVALVCAVAVIAGSWRSQTTWDAAHPRQLGRYVGWAELVGDPAPLGRGLRVTLEIGDERFDAWAYGSPRRRLAERQSGDVVWVSGTRRPNGDHARRALVRHVVGRFELDYTGDIATAAPLDRASAKVRAALREAAEATMPADEAALFTGLVIGDDAREPPAMIQAFRDAGLSHLTAVSGQNVAYLLLGVGLLVRRLRPWWRWTVSVGLIGWFMALTRFEPSILRAGVMAVLAITGFTLGRRQHPAGLLAVAVTVLAVVDPFLVWSVGLWLSVGATAGVCTVGPWLAERLRGPPWWRLALGTALGAQAGIVVPSLLVFHRLPVVSIPANLLAVPVAGAVMLVGLPAGLLAGWGPAVVRDAVMLPCRLGTRWVATVAEVSARLEPSGVRRLVAWAILLAVVAALLGRRCEPGPDAQRWTADDPRMGREPSSVEERS